MKYPKRSQYKYAKSPYRIRNWPEYEAGLRRRGDLTVWLSDDAINSWRALPSGMPGGQRTYANIAIEAALTIRMVFQLPLRQTEGFLRSLAEKLELNIPIPDHTTLSRRLKTLGEISFRAIANVGLSTCSSTAPVLGFTSAICGSHRKTGPGGSCTLWSTRALARSSRRI